MQKGRWGMPVQSMQGLWWYFYQQVGPSGYANRVLRIHRSSRFVSCPICDKQFTSTDGYSRHIMSERLKHPNCPSPPVEYLRLVEEQENDDEAALELKGGERGKANCLNMSNGLAYLHVNIFFSQFFPPRKEDRKWNCDADTATRKCSQWKAPTGWGGH